MTSFGLPFTFALFVCPVVLRSFRMFVCLSFVALLFLSVSQTRRLLNAMLCSFVLCFLYVGAGFDSPVMFDALVRPRLR